MLVSGLNNFVYIRFSFLYFLFTFVFNRTLPFSHKFDQNAPLNLTQERDIFPRIFCLCVYRRYKLFSVRYLGILKSSKCYYNFSSKVLSSKTINVTALYQYAVGNHSEMAKLMDGKDGGKNAMRLANTLLSVMSAASDNELKKTDKMKVRNFVFYMFLQPVIQNNWFLFLAVDLLTYGYTDLGSLENTWARVELLSAIVLRMRNSYAPLCAPNLRLQP